MPKVSVLIPVYNNEVYLKQCLESVLGQTLADIEIICINDGSTDKSLEIIKGYEAIDKRVIVIDKLNSGYGDSLNKGLNLAKGEFIAVVESDDFIESDMLSCLYEKAVLNDLDIIKSDYYEYKSDNGDIYRALNHSKAYNNVFVPYRFSNIFTGEIYLWTSLYRKSFLDKNDISFNTTPGASYQDVSFTFKALACADRVLSVDRAFYHYRLDNPNSSVKSKEKVYCICDEFAEIERFCSRRLDIRQRMKNVIPYMMFKRYMGTYWRIDRKFKGAFLIRLKNDLARYSEEEINQGIWSSEDWDFYQNIKDKCVDTCLQRKLYELVNPAIVEYLKDRDVYIYGAGKVGKRIRNWLESYGINTKCFLVTSDGASEDGDLPIKIFSEVRDEISDKVCILVAVGEKFQGEIVTFLLEQGVTNIIPMNREMRQILEIG